MAALSPAQENALSLWLAIILAALLALALAAVITSPPQTDSPPAVGGDAEPYLPKHASEPPAPRCRAASRASPGLPTPVTRPVPRA